MTLSIPELRPWRARFDFLVYYEPEDGPPYEYEYVLAGYALERTVTLEEANSSPDTARLTPDKVRRFAEDIFLYQQVAVLTLRFVDEDADALHRRVLDSYLEVFARAWRDLAGSGRRQYELMDIFDVRSRQTIWRWRDKAVAKGLLAEDEIERR